MKRGPRAIAWTPEMDAALHEGRTRGLGWIELAEVIGVSHDTVGKRINELGLPPLRPWAKWRAKNGR